MRAELEWGARRGAAIEIVKAMREIPLRRFIFYQLMGGMGE
jgi:hypothetical protein